jgi:YggT family protein
MQHARIRPVDGLGQFAVSMTNWVVLPLRRVFSGWGGIDWSCWVALLLLAFVGKLGALLLFQAVSPASIGLTSLLPAVLVGTLSYLLQQAVYFLIVLVLANVVLSWVAPFSPLRAVLGPLLEPFLNPIRRMLPKTSGFDFSPLLLIVGLQVVLIVLKSIGF